jgi:phosphoribosylformimino-5-aminoimidazole carboxamide ribotide isomerase
VDLLPSIDVRSGRVVRLSQGEPTRQTVYGDDPVAVAERFVDAGARWIHVVDLDRALSAGENLATIEQIARRVGAKVRLQLGGGFRSLDLIRAGLDLGVARVVIGTAAATDPRIIAAAVAELGSDRLAVGIDAREGYVALRGWSETSSQAAGELARQVVADGIGTLIYTDIGRDGMLRGPDLTGATALQPTGARIILSGGVSSSGEVRDACNAGLAGVIVGRALYEGRMTLAEALAAADCSASS